MHRERQIRSSVAESSHTRSNGKLLFPCLSFGCVSWIGHEFLKATSSQIIELFHLLTWDNLWLFTAQDWASLVFVSCLLACYGLLVCLSRFFFVKYAGLIVRRLQLG